MALSSILCGSIRGWERREWEQQAGNVTRGQAEKLQISMLRSLEVLHSIASLHAAAGRIEHQPFQDFVRQALSRQPELQALSWNPRVPDAQRTAFETNAGFPFRERADSDAFVTALPRSEYVPVYFIEPLDRNALALGYDLNSDPLRRGALEQARDSAQPVATAALHLAQSPGNRAGVLVLLPVYRGPTPSDVAARRERVAGFAVAVFRLADLVGHAFEELRTKGIQARLFDRSPGGDLLYEEGPVATGWSPAVGAPAQTALDFAGRRWAVEFTPTAGFKPSLSHRQSWLVLGSGMAFTLLVSGYLYGGWKRNREVAAANGALQKEVHVRQQAESAAAAANAAKSDFLASMSHEIRTPLNAILGYTQLIQRDARLLPEQRDAIQGISASGHHLLGLLNEILDLSKIEAGQMQLSTVDFDLSALGRDLLATFQPLCAQKGIRIRIDFAGPDRIPVRGDEGKLRQVLINLVGNAVKFTHRGGVHLGCQTQAENEWRFEVIDTGLGIPEPEQAVIFQPFHQGSGARDHGGTGLGLAIAQRQVELLGGHLELQSARGVGSRFHFTIPLATGVTLPEERETLQVLRLSPGRQVQVLVVDDRPENRDVLGGLLTSIGAAVFYASNGPEAIQQTLGQRIDIVFMDLLLPGLSGEETTRRILADPASGLPKIIAHTASAVTQHRNDAQAAGCVDFLAKPFRCEQLYECLRLHLGVKFEWTAPERPAERLTPIESLRITLPDELYARLNLAAELHSTTALKGCLEDLRQLDPDAQLLAEHIRHLMRSYDMDGILRLLTRVTTPRTTGMPIPL